MLHRLRSAVSRSAGRTQGESPAERLTGLLVPVGGWLPPAADGPAPWLPAPAEQDEQDWPWDGDGGPDGDGPDDGGPDDGGPDDDAQAPDDVGSTDRSWGPTGRHAAAEPAQRWRLDLGRSAVGALLLVAALAALLAAGVVLRGRPQEVAAPVVETRTSAAAESAGSDRGGPGEPSVDATGVPLPGRSSAPVAAEPSGEVVVAVAGKVQTPGLVRLPAGSRVDDAVRAAGGPLDPGAVGLLNLARVLVDGEQVLVGVDPPPGSVPALGTGGAGGPAAGRPLDLNAASASDLDALPGIGPVLAQRIVDWRTENGRFASVDQLREVTGIGEAKYQDLVEKVVV